MSAMKEKIKGFVAGVIFRVIALLTLGQISPILSACIIIEQDGKILLIDRSDGLGYTIVIHSLVGVYSSLHRDPRFRAVSIAYQGAIVSGSVQDSSEGKPCWREPGEVFGHMAF